MTARGARMWLAAAAATAALAGCGPAPGQSAPVAGPAQPPGLATTQVTTTGAWAVAELGGPAANHNNFWQLFTRPAGSTAWHLVTPPGMATNGGLVMAGPVGHVLTTGFRPSQQISFSPLTVTADGGAHWKPGLLLDAGLADAPGALAASPDSGRLLALLPGAVEESRPGGTGWARLLTRRSLNATAAGRDCGLSRLTAVTFSPSGAPLVAGTCTHPGTAGVFTLTDGTWHRAGPAMPAALAGRGVAVLRLAVTGTHEAVLLAAGTGPHTVLLAAWADAAGRWQRSPTLASGGARVRSASFGPTGQVGVITAGARAAVLTGPGASWRRLPALPRWAQALAIGPGRQVQALAAHRSTMAVWQDRAGAAGWAQVQSVHVPVQYGSSS